MSKEFSVEQIQALMKSVSENHIGELQFETEGVKLKIKNWMMAPSAGEGSQPAAVLAAPAAAPVAVAVAQAGEPSLEKSAEEPKVITSPLVGTFYAASGPDKEPYVKVGSAVKAGEIVFIVESMKVMNEIPADQSGTVVEILVADGAPVEYGQPVLRLE